MNEQTIARNILMRLQAVPVDTETQQATEALMILEALRDDLEDYVKVWRVYQMPHCEAAIARGDWTADFNRNVLAKLEYMCNWFERLKNIHQDAARALYIELTQDDSYPGDNHPLGTFFIAALNRLWRAGKLPALTAGACECERLNTEAALEARAAWKLLHGDNQPTPPAILTLIPV